MMQHGMGQEEFDARMEQGEDPYALVAEDHKRKGQVTVQARGGASVTITLGRPFTSEISTATAQALQIAANVAVSILESHAEVPR
jgi:hypothetical protein